MSKSVTGQDKVLSYMEKNVDKNYYNKKAEKDKKRFKKQLKEFQKFGYYIENEYKPSLDYLKDFSTDSLPLTAAHHDSRAYNQGIPILLSYFRFRMSYIFLTRKTPRL